ncbi:MAG: FAD-binding protein [Acidobacteria bacterium]|nr:FAD-binding protein [Acidobacteriota bacterium]
MNKREFLKGSAAMLAVAATSRAGAAAAGKSAPRTNWSGNYRYHAPQLFEPSTVAEVQQAVRSATNVHALGSRHSFNGVADSSVAQISMLKINDVQLDTQVHTVTVGAGIKYGDLARQLDQRGYAVHNLASLPHISVAGAVSTATHGSGMKNGNLSSAVTGIEFVAADGSLHQLTRKDNPDVFPGAIVALGALGIMTKVTLKVEPSFQMTQVVYRNLSFSELEHNLAAIMQSAYSVSLFTNWQDHRCNQVWLKRRVDQGGAEKPPALFYNATLATRKMHPIDDHPAEACTDQENKIGPWYERLPHFRMNFTPSSGEEIQSEFFVPFEHGYEAIMAVETLRDQITPHLYASEFRTIAADDLWLSMAYQRPSLALHFTWKREPEAVAKIVPQIEAKLAPFAVRPHWAKVFTMKTDPLYSRLNDFKALAAKYDPQGKFRNDFVRKCLYE